jgi:hypothetical protein
MALAICLVPCVASAEIVPDTQRWAPGIGDPTVAGWITVVAYFAVTLQCVANWAISQSRERWIWFGITICMAFLCINKQLDLQTWLTQAGRDYARAHGWYEVRRPYQIGFVAALTVLSLIAVALLRIHLAASWSRFWLAITGITGLLFFVIMRAATVHHVDILLGMDLGKLTINNVLELTAIGTVAAGALMWKVRKSREVADNA